MNYTFNRWLISKIDAEHKNTEYQENNLTVKVIWLLQQILKEESLMTEKQSKKYPTSLVIRGT